MPLGSLLRLRDAGQRLRPDPLDLGRGEGRLLDDRLEQVERRGEIGRQRRQGDGAAVERRAGADVARRALSCLGDLLAGQVAGAFVEQRRWSGLQAALVRRVGRVAGVERQRHWVIGTAVRWA